MKKFIFYIVCINILISCKEKNNYKVLTPIVNFDVNDLEYRINDSFSKGDSRRYGVFPNQPISTKRMSNILDLAAKGLPITFPKGVYKSNLVFNGVSNVNLIFKEATICGAINIFDGSNKIKFSGQLTILDKLFIRKSSNIQFDTLLVKTDIVKNIYKKKNRGVSIYAGSKMISFKFLRIDDTGGVSEDHYKHSAAALQVHGWNDNPEYVYIANLEINNSDRTALYITGRGHQIGKGAIHNYGLGDSINMFGLEDAKPGEEKEFTGAWINRCNDCVIDTLAISSNVFAGKYSLRLDEGVYHTPTFINNVHFKSKAKELPIKTDELTNILVKNEY